ncbi:uncharacterized protein LOC117121117 [Anneissia japonica]|uniref:uncharacterized protein LOC117121117 n=1 Tax=Anneissia japonica TaxID=1529436 RepID=UPI001425B30B|nr:uncharacterized protein LOC117121117 [Anneissia japonica]
MNGFVCQKQLVVTRDTPTTRLVKTFTDDDITTIDYEVTPGVISTQQSKQDESKMSNAVIPISIALAVAVIGIVVLAILFIKRRNSKNGAPGTSPPTLEIHDVPTTEMNQQGNGDNSSNLHAKYGASLQEDYVQLNETAQKNHNPNYNNQYEYPVFPFSVENSKAETLLNGDQYDVLNLEEEGNTNSQYDVLSCEKEGSLDAQYDVLNHDYEGSLHPQYDVLNREKEGSFNPQYDVLNPDEIRKEQSPVVYPEDVEDEMPEDEYFYGDFKQ